MKPKAILLALMAAVFYAVNTPVSKLFLSTVPPTLMAALLYLGAGIGVGVMYLFHLKKEDRSERLTRSDLPYTVGMILLDVAAPIFMMTGIRLGSASGASLLGNFEIVATTLIALLIFREKVTTRLWIAIGLITLSGVLLSFEGGGGTYTALGSLFVILATVCWGLENNCTRKISGKSTYQIVMLKGIFSGLGSLIVTFVTGGAPKPGLYVPGIMLLGFISYGLSIFAYIRAQRWLGAAKTAAFYAVAPFIGVLLAFLLVGERPGPVYFAALAVMMIGTAFVVWDTLGREEGKG